MWVMSANILPNIRDGQGEVNLRLSAEDIAGLGPDVQSLLRQLASSQQELQQRHSTPSSSHSGVPAGSLSAHGREMILRLPSSESAAGPPSSNTPHRTLPNNWHRQAAAGQPTEKGLDDFGRLYNRIYYFQRLYESPIC